MPRGLLLVANVCKEGKGNLLGIWYLLAGKVGAFLVVDGVGNDHITNRALGGRRFEPGLGGHN